ncbi:MAG: porin family protein [Bacteroidales bacterium]
MKKLFVIILLAFIVIPAFSQVQFGLKAGLSTTNLKMEDLKTLTSGDTEYTVEALKGANYGFHGGAFIRLSLLGLYVQPEFLFASRTDEYTVVDLANPTLETIKKQQFNRIDIPIMLGVHLGPIRLNAGPSANLLINKPKDLIDHPDFKAMYSNLTFGYQAGLGFDILKKLTVDLRYEGSLQKYQTKIENATGTTFKLDDRPNAFLLSVGIIF